LSLNVPAVELLAEVGPARFLARLRQVGTGIVLPSDAAPGLASGSAGSGSRSPTSPASSRLRRGRRGPDPPAPGRGPRPRGRAGPGHGSVAAWYVADILRGAPPPDHAPARQIAFKTGTSYGYRDAWAAGFDRRITIGVWVGRPDGHPVPGLVGRAVAAPILFDAFARLGLDPQPVERPPHAIQASTAALPPPLRHLRQDVPKTVAATTQAALKIAFPLDGSRVELGFTRPTDLPGTLVLKASGGVPPLTWLVNGAPVGEPALRRQSTWQPGRGGLSPACR
jgi:penicillin-binding protein 1C